MSRYELLVVLRPDLEEEEVSEAVDRLKSVISDQGGTEETTEVQGRRRLAYPVKKHTDGTVVLSRFDMPPDKVKEVGNGIRLDERYLRNILVRL